MCKNCDDPSLSRRHLMLGVGAACAAAAWSPRSTLAADEPPQNAITPDAALERLMQGNKRYAANE
ncbi:MAG: carbonic anhydrase, partial [Methyloceanibacter sp.]